jgi:hypothetical protein
MRVILIVGMEARAFRAGTATEPAAERAKRVKSLRFIIEL